MSETMVKNSVSDLIIFNTEDSVKEQPSIQTPNIFQLVNEKDPILKEVMPEFDFNNPPVDPDVFSSTLIRTCKYHRGLGLSANQCGFKYRVFVIGGSSEFVPFFNPKLLSSTGEIHLAEGCLSFPLLELKVTRPETIDVEYQTITGEVVQAKFTGLTARCFLHELDHMNGIVYTERTKPMALSFGKDKRNKLIKMMNKLRK